MGKTSTEAKNKWMKNNYDFVSLTLPKGDKEKIQAYAATRGESVNALIRRLLAEEMERGEND